MRDEIRGDGFLLAPRFAEHVSDYRSDDDGATNNRPSGRALANEHEHPNRIQHRLDVTDDAGVERARRAPSPM